MDQPMRYLLVFFGLLLSCLFLIGLVIQILGICMSDDDATAMGVTVVYVCAWLAGDLEE